MAHTKKVSFTNTSDGPRGVNGLNGVVLIEKGQSAEVEVSGGEFKSAMATGYVGNGAGAEPGPLDQSVEKLTAYLEGVDDAAEIDRLIEAEKGGKSRAGALAALEARKEALSA